MPLKLMRVAYTPSGCFLCSGQCVASKHLQRKAASCVLEVSERCSIIASDLLFPVCILKASSTYIVLNRTEKRIRPQQRHSLAICSQTMLYRCAQGARSTLPMSRSCHTMLWLPQTSSVNEFWHRCQKGLNESSIQRYGAGATMVTHTTSGKQTQRMMNIGHAAHYRQHT
jgi:hypothetical protein